MAEHERINDMSSERFWPLDEGVSQEGCPECDFAIAHFLGNLEVGLRIASLDLWIAGWTPDELVSEVRRITSCFEASTLVAQILIVDDSHRSDQARPPEWSVELEALRARTGVSNVEAGWLTAWLADQPSASQASACLKAVSDALGDLVAPVMA